MPKHEPKRIHDSNIHQQNDGDNHENSSPSLYRDKIKVRDTRLIAEFEGILKKGIEKKTSDIHLKVGQPPILRIHGQLFFLGNPVSDPSIRLTHEKLELFTKNILTEYQWQRLEKNLEIDLGYDLENLGRFRINICFERGNLRMVARYIPDKIPNFQELGLPSILNDIIQNKRGLILVTGKTGSGKSTTLASMIDAISRANSCHIVTIEDPIEFSFRDRKSVITQRELGIDTISFSDALKHALRQDPDVILIGEMRDEETIKTALNAADTGHLVVSTLHTLDATETIHRIVHTISKESQSSIRQQLSSVLRAVISQRLLRKKNSQSRVLATEILLVNQRVKILIEDPKRTQELKDVIEESMDLGMHSFDQDILMLLKKNLIDEEEALLYCSNIRDFKLKLGGIQPTDLSSAVHESYQNAPPHDTRHTPPHHQQAPSPSLPSFFQPNTLSTSRDGESNGESSGTHLKQLLMEPKITLSTTNKLDPFIGDSTHQGKDNLNEEKREEKNPNIPTIKKLAPKKLP